MIFMDGGRKAAFDLNNPYHRNHWDVLMALAREEFVGEPVLSAELKSYLNQDRPQGSEILHIAASIKFLRRRIEKDPEKPTILLQGGSAIHSTFTLRARVVELDAPDEQKEKEERKKTRTLIPYSESPEIDLSFLGNEKVEAEQLIERLERIRDEMDISLTNMFLSRFVANIRGEGASLTKKASEILDAVCPDIEEGKYSTIINREKFLKIITGYDEGPERGIYIVGAVAKTLKGRDRPQNPRFPLGGKSADLDRDMVILETIGATQRQIIGAIAGHLGIETPQEYRSEKPHPKIHLYEKGGRALPGK